MALRIQGGPMSPEQARAFEAGPFFEDAVKLRRWDEEGKIVGYQGPALAHFERYIFNSCSRISNEGWRPI